MDGNSGAAAADTDATSDSRSAAALLPQTRWMQTWVVDQFQRRPPTRRHQENGQQLQVSSASSAPSAVNSHPAGVSGGCRARRLGVGSCRLDPPRSTHRMRYAALLLLLAPLPIAAQSTAFEAEIDRRALAVNDRVVAWRRDIH